MVPSKQGTIPEIVKQYQAFQNYNSINLKAPLVTDLLGPKPLGNVAGIQRIGYIGGPVIQEGQDATYIKEPLGGLGGLGL